jgi:hypothetical protein
MWHIFAVQKLCRDIALPSLIPVATLPNWTHTSKRPLQQNQSCYRSRPDTENPQKRACFSRVVVSRNPRGEACQQIRAASARVHDMQIHHGGHHHGRHRQGRTPQGFRRSELPSKLCGNRPERLTQSGRPSRRSSAGRKPSPHHGSPRLAGYQGCCTGRADETSAAVCRALGGGKTGYAAPRSTRQTASRQSAEGCRNHLQNGNRLTHPTGQHSFRIVVAISIS